METEEAGWPKGSSVGCLDDCGLDDCGLAGCRVPHRCPSRTPSWATCCLKRMFLPGGGEGQWVYVCAWILQPSRCAPSLSRPPLPSPISVHMLPLYGWFPLPPLSLDTRHPTPLPCMGVKKEPPKLSLFVVGLINHIKIQDTPQTIKLIRWPNSNVCYKINFKK